MFEESVSALKTWIGFNEAGARMLRKFPEWGILLATFIVASMRPEHGCSGNVLVAVTERGRTFNEAGARMLRKWQNIIGHNALDQRASMRPEHGCSGNVVSFFLQKPFMAASMRPEHGCSGNAF